MPGLLFSSSLTGAFGLLGARVTFVSTAAGTHDPATATFTGGAETRVSGVAIRGAGNPKLYKAMGLVESEAPTLNFIPDVVGAATVLGAVVVWEGQTFRVRAVDAGEPCHSIMVSR